MPIPSGGDAYNPSTPVGMVRLLIADTSPTDPLLSDADLQAMLAVESDNVKLAAATALEVIARSEVLISKKISTQDLSTDGPAVAAELRAQAKSLRDQVAQEREDEQQGADDAAWDMSVIDFDPNAAYRWW